MNVMCQRLRTIEVLRETTIHTYTDNTKTSTEPLYFAPGERLCVFGIIVSDNSKIYFIIKSNFSYSTSVVGGYGFDHTIEDLFENSKEIHM